MTAPQNAPAPLPVRPAIPVVDPQAGSEFDLDALIRSVAAGGYQDTDSLAALVVASLHPSQVREALLQAVAALCRQRYSIRTSPRPRARREPLAPFPQPMPVASPEPALGEPRKVDAARVLAALPNRLNEKVNVGTVKDPDWKFLGSCTPSDLFEAIENARDMARTHETTAETFLVIHNALVQHRIATVREFVRSGRLA